MIEVYAAVTNIGRRLRGAQHLSTFHFVITDFAIGDQGHDQNNPRIALVPNLNQTEYNNGFPLLHGPTPLESASMIAPYYPRFTFRLNRGEAVGEWSQINLIATVITSPGALMDGTLLPGVGEQFLFAIVNRPLVIRADIDEDEYAIVARS
jgi:hypothetical protein